MNLLGQRCLHLRRLGTTLPQIVVTSRPTGTSAGVRSALATLRHFATRTLQWNQNCSLRGFLRSGCRHDQQFRCLTVYSSLQSAGANHSASQESIDVETDLLSKDTLHNPVLVNEIVKVIGPKDGQVIVDMTFGAGGHTRALLECCPNITVYALDRDPTAFQLAQKLAQTRPHVVPLLGCFTELPTLLESVGAVKQIDAVLFDFGVSSMQFDSMERGFALSRCGPLDMRMDGSRVRDQLTAEDIVNNMDENGLREIIKKYGEEKRARHIARAIVDSRYAFGRITTTHQLANIVAGVYQGQETKRDKLDRPAHVATKTFQALRIFVNNELNELHNGLNVVHALLRPNGLCVAITFHSLEDRIVKRHFTGQDVDAKANMSVTDRHHNPSVSYEVDELREFLTSRWQPVWKGVLTPGDEEIARNPRARSAKLRAARKL